MAQRPFAGSRQPPPIAFLDDYLPEPRSAFDRAAEPILRAVLAQDDVPPQRVIQVPIRNQVVSASMSNAAAAQEIYQIRVMNVDPNTQSFATPTKVYVEDVDLDARITWALNSSDSGVGSDTRVYHPLDDKMGLRVALIEVDMSDSVVGGTTGAAGLELAPWPPVLRDLLVEPNGYWEGGDGESLYLKGPTDPTQYYSPWRRSRDQAASVAFSIADTLGANPTTGNFSIQYMQTARGDYTAGYLGDTRRQLRNEMPSPYTFRVLFDKQYEFAGTPCDWFANTVPVPTSVAGNQVAYDIPGHYTTGTVKTYHGRIREKIRLNRTYNFGRNSPTNGTVASANLCLRRLLLVLIPKNTCKWTQNNPSTSIFPIYSPKVLDFTLEQTGAIQTDLFDNDQLGITYNDAYISRSEVQAIQHGNPRLDMGERRSWLSRSDEAH